VVHLCHIRVQTGGSAFLFLCTDDFWADYRALVAKAAVFVRKPRSESYGTVAVFQDLYGNLWDLIQHHAAPSPTDDTSDLPGRLVRRDKPARRRE
jgi:hypothetical protein